MTDIDAIKYLLNEIEQEQEYNEQYNAVHDKAEEEAAADRASGSKWVNTWDYMPKKFNHFPRTSVIKSNAKKIRQLLLKLY